MSFNKIVVSGVVAVSLFGASLASAQTYYSTTSYGTSSGSCVNLTQNLSYGSRGSQVSALQTFLVAQNYPGGGSWMISGFYGSATMAAVRNFQQAHGLAATGAVDSSTRAAISNCGNGYVYNQNQYQYQTYPSSFAQGYGGTQYSYQIPPYTNYNNNNYNNCGTYPYYYSCTNYGSTPTLTSLSVTSASAGTQVIAYGSGFDTTSNTVYVGGMTIPGVPSNGTSIAFAVPANANGTISVSVSNSRGTSNSLTLYVSGNSNGYPYPCNNNSQYQYQYQSGYNYNYNGYCPPVNTGTPTISYLSPNSGAVGTSVTVYGSGFSSSGNTVRFGNGIISNLTSSDGRTVTFTVPSYLTGYGYQPVGLGTYQVSVSNNTGVVSNAVPFTITSVGSSGTPTIGSVSGPNMLTTGTTGTWSVTVQNPSSTYLTVSVNWGDTGNGYANQAAPQTTYASGSTTFTFTHAYFTSGNYTVTFTVSNSSGQSAISSATVSVSGSSNNGSVVLNSISPTSGRVGTQIMLTGSGFTGDNTVHFGVGGTMHLTSQSNTYLYYTVPSYLSPCDVTPQGGVCAQYLQQVTPGTYQVYVTNQNGTSQSLNFTVTQ
jgi:hypothetical protein